MSNKPGETSKTIRLIQKMIKQMTMLWEKVDVMQKNPTMSSEARDSDEEMDCSSGGLVELSEMIKTSLEAAFLANMPNEDHKKRVGKVRIPDYDQVCCPKLDGVLKAVLLKDAVKADGYFHVNSSFGWTQWFPSSFVGERRSRGIDARKGGFSHPDCPVLNGECASTNDTKFLCRVHVYAKFYENPRGFGFFC